MPGVFPDYPAPVVRIDDGYREMIMMRWGMPPPPKFGGPPVTNIRNTSSPHWRGWLKPENRCLVPANSFSEYAPETNPETKKKDVVWFALNDDRPTPAEHDLIREPMEAGIYAHFRSIAESTTMPIVLHDIPSRTVRELSDDNVARLAESQKFIGIKDATGDVTRPPGLKPLARPEFRLLSGDDASAAAFLFYGGDGCISVTSNVAPALCNQIYLTAKGGSPQATRRTAIELTELTTVLSLDSIPAALKYALSLGLILPDVRLPIAELFDSSKARTAIAIATICLEDSELSLYG
jgi:hypothetical protein